MSANDQIKSFFQRWENLEAEKKQIADLLKDLFAEAKGFGYNTKALRAAFNLKVKQDLDSPVDAEFEATIDIYMSALNAPAIQARDARVRARENIEKIASDGTKYDAASGEILDGDDVKEAEEQDAPERPSNNDEPSPEAGPQAEASPAGTGAGTLADREGRHNDPDQPHAGGGHEVAAHSNAATKPAGALVNHPPAKPLRPLCRNPGEHCGGYGSVHCSSCLRAAKEIEVAA